MVYISKIPNAITISRIIFSITLLFIKPLSGIFFIVYIFCGLSDVIDGYIARKSNSTSQFGATLDSIADFIFICISLFKFIPLVNIPTLILIWILAIMLIRLLSLAIGYYKYHSFAFLHTYSNKITGFVLFLFPILFNFLGIISTAIVICVVASISVIEEVSINITSKELLRNIKYINFR